MTDVTPAPSTSDFQQRASCLGCGYALRGLAEPRCPECGREFDPDDAMTMRVPGVSRRPPPKPAPFSSTMILAAVLIALETAFGMWTASGEATVLGLLGWFGVLVFWKVHDVRERLAAARGEAIPPDTGPRAWRTIVVTLFVLSMLPGFGLHRCPHGRYYRYGPFALFRSSSGGGSGGPCRNVMSVRRTQLSENWYFLGP